MCLEWNEQRALGGEEIRKGASVALATEKAYTL